jgi:hypothetical protein
MAGGRALLLALSLGAAVPAAACDISLHPPVLDPATGTLRAGAERGPGCPTAMRLVVFMKERMFGVDRILARGERTLRDGRVDLAYACGPAKDMNVYVQVGDSRETKHKSAAVAIAGCG